MGNGTMERDIIYSRHSCKSSKRFALTAPLLREGMELERISRIVGVASGRHTTTEKHARAKAMAHWPPIHAISRPVNLKHTKI